MIRAHELEGRAVVDVDAAEKIGKIDEVILDPDAGQVAAFAVSRGEKLLGGGGHVTVPAWSVQAIGPDALTVRHTAVLGDDAHRFEGLPRLSDVVGRKVVTQSGKLLGTVEDVLINADDARIVGYVLDEQPGPMRKLEALFSGDGKSASAHYVRADTNLR